MEPGAYEMLAKFALPTPKRWAVAEIETVDEAVIFVRSGNRAKPSKAMALVHLREQLANGIHDSAEILSLDEVVEAEFSGVVVTFDGGFYAECVPGQLEELVRQSSFSSRMLGSDTAELKTYDVGLAVQAALQCKDLSNVFQMLPKKMLFEFLFCRRRKSVVFVDAKSFAWQIDFANLFDDDLPEVIFGRLGENVELKSWADFERLDPSTLSLSAVRLGKRALLCHSITYALKGGIGALIR
jgi:hypothetical protein